MTKNDHGVPGRWNRRQRELGIIAWISFLSACVGTFIIFAVLDPEALNDAWMMPWEMSRELAYSLGFLFLLAIAMLASALTVYMIRTGPAKGHYQGKGRRAPPQVDTHAAKDPALELDPGEWRE